LAELARKVARQELSQRAKLASLAKAVELTKLVGRAAAMSELEEWEKGREADLEGPPLQHLQPVSCLSMSLRLPRPW
jgi:hypothetical protein